MERYIKIEKGDCGAGTYGEVYKARDQKTNKIVAMKVTHHNELFFFTLYVQLNF